MPWSRLTVHETQHQHSGIGMLLVALEPSKCLVVETKLSASAELSCHI